MTRYPFPWDLFAALGSDLVGGERSLAGDSALMVARIHPGPCVEGNERIPRSGPLMVAANHYQRRGLWIGWPGAVISEVMATVRGTDPPIHWLVTGGLRLFQFAGRGPEVPGTRLIFERVAAIYGMTALPVSDTRGRMGALLGWLRRAQAGQVLGIFPEGAAGRSDHLRAPDPQFGRLCALMATFEVEVLPVGIHEQEGRLHVRFGEARTMADADEVMRSIAALLPARMRDAYGEVSGGALE